MAQLTESAQIERQTTQIIECLFADDDQVDCRQLDADFGLETDCPVAGEENFDPVPIADKLKEVAESLNEDVKFKAALADLKLALVQEAMEGSFSHGIETLLQTQISQKAANVVPEMQLIRVCVAFGLFIKESCPELKTKAQRAVTTFLNSRVASWVTQQGGWEKVRENIGDV